MFFSIVKEFLSAFVKLSKQVTPHLTPSVIQILRGPRETNAQKPPLNSTDIPSQLEEVFLRKTPLPEQTIYIFEKVTVSWNGIVLKGFHLFVPSLAFFTYEDEYSGVFLLRQWFSKKIKLNTTVGLVFDNWSVSNYYHWLIDALPRLLLLRERYSHCALLIPFPIPDYILLTTAALGFHNIVALAKGSFIQVQSLVMPSHLTHPGYQEPVLIRNVREELLKAYGYSEDIASSLRLKRIYISRSRQHVRRLLNEKDTLLMLLKYNFEIVYFEEMGFEQQVKTMQCAEVIMGVHGANMANMLFLKSGARVIELLNKEVCNPCYFQLASNLELDYYAIFCNPILASGPVNNQDIEVDIHALENTLQTVFQS